MLVKARVVVQGYKASAEDYALVDTGSTVSMLDRSVAEKLGVEKTGRVIKLLVADGHEVEGELAIVKRLAIGGRDLPGAHVALIEFDIALKERLKSQGLSEWCIIGLATLEILGLSPNTSKGTVEETGALLL